MHNFLHFAILVVTVAKFNAKGTVLRNDASRVRTTNVFASPAKPSDLIDQLETEKHNIDAQIDQGKSTIELMQVITGFHNEFSMTAAPTAADTVPPLVTSYPSFIPSTSVSDLPSVSTQLSAEPTSILPDETLLPSSEPSVPLSTQPSAEPTSILREETLLPSSEPSTPPMSSSPTAGPTLSSSAPTVSKSPSSMPSTSASDQPTSWPTVSNPPSSIPSTTVSDQPTTFPGFSNQPSAEPTPEETLPMSSEPTALPVSLNPTHSPTLLHCGVTPIQRALEIMNILDGVADSGLIRDFSTPQGQAANWILLEDLPRLCQNNEKLVQRWVMAVMYFSTGGPEWIQCSAEALNDLCGLDDRFQGKQRFLSTFNECEWAGNSCNAQECVTEIEFGKLLFTRGSYRTENHEPLFF
jgi:hypothetical protein